MGWPFLFLASALMMYLTVANPLRVFLAYLGIYHPVTQTRLRQYLFAFLHTWMLMLLLIIVCLGMHWSSQQLGLLPPSNLLLAGLLLVLILCSVTMMVLFQRWFTQHIMQPDVELQSYHSQLQRSSLLPSTTKERIFFVVVALNAGICEELLYRGFFPLSLTHIFPWCSFVWAIVISSGCFGIAHLAIRPDRKIRWLPALVTGIFGLMAGLFYLVTGSLFLSLIFHSLFDLRVLFFKRSA